MDSETTPPHNSANSGSKFYSNCGFFALFACFFCWLFASFADYYPGKVHTNYLLDFETAKYDDEDGLLLPPVKIENLDELYEIKLCANFYGSFFSECTVICEIADADTFTINGFKSEFWKESGFEAGEYWQETSPCFRESFKFDKAGVYFIRLFVDFDEETEKKAIYTYRERHNSFRPKISFTLYEGAYAVRYFVFAGLVFFLLSIVFFSVPVKTEKK
jgi:hypothetical protein